MKKAIIILISVLLITSFAACRNGDAETAGTTVPENTTAESTAEISSAPQTIEKTLDGVTLKVYIENVSVENITFGCGEAGCYGICQARRMVFLTTRGSAYEGSHLEMGSRYLQAMAEFFGIDRYDCVAADGLDAMGANPESILRAASRRVRSSGAAFPSKPV